MTVSGVRTVSVWRMGGSSGQIEADRVAVEAPLEVRLDDEPFSVIMRTPGADVDLAAGFLFAEGVLRSARDIAGMTLDPAGEWLDVTLAADRSSALPAFLASRRQVAMNSSCGLCGRRTLESLELDIRPLEAAWTMPVGVVARLPAALHASQATFAETGGLHAAALFRPDGSLETIAEDVGRHNAVDKLIGRMLLAGRLPLAERLLFVSGRSSFEIVQKALLGGIPIVAAVSAPSSLAVDLADRCGITLLGFVRDARFNVYTHVERIA
jgi:FdhD protein